MIIDLKKLFKENPIPTSVKDKEGLHLEIRGVDRGISYVITLEDASEKIYWEQYVNASVIAALYVEFLTRLLSLKDVPLGKPIDPLTQAVLDLQGINVFKEKKNAPIRRKVKPKAIAFGEPVFRPAGYAPARPNYVWNQVPDGVAALFEAAPAAPDPPPDRQEQPRNDAGVPEGGVVEQPLDQRLVDAGYQQVIDNWAGGGILRAGEQIIPDARYYHHYAEQIVLERVEPEEE